MKLLITKLDKRLLKSSKASGKNFTRLKRMDGEPITSEWAVDSTFQSDSEARSSGVDIGSSSVGGASTEVESELEDSDFAIES